MTFPDAGNTHRDEILDAAWLARCEPTELFASDGVTCHLLYDPAAERYWLTRSAHLTDSCACEKLQNELRIAERLRTEWAAVPLTTIWTTDRMIVVFPADASCRPAGAQSSVFLPLATFFEFAISAARALAEAHAHGIVHGDIRPQSLLVNGDHAVRLTAFGYATVLDAETPVLRETSSMAQAYLAPELARQAESAANPKSDLYSFGITLYELLTGTTPFVADSPAGWQHAHIAIEPMPPQSRRPEVPAQLGSIILKLMAKDPGGRYVSASSAASDLARAREELNQSGDISRFALDQSGAPPALTPSAQLFGRSAEIGALTGALERVAKQGKSELVLIGGGAGTGKSALANVLASRAVHGGIRFTSGKSDQQQLTIPYAPVSQMIRSLTMELLGEDELTLVGVRDRWLAALEGQGKAIAELVPEVEHVLGVTAPLSNVSAQQAKARVETAILRTFSAFAKAGVPLVLFIDDLQWADQSTLALFEAFTQQPPANVLLLAAYRDESRELAERLAWLLHAKRSSAVPLTRIDVKPLAVQQLAELIGAALNEPLSRMDALSRAVHVKTAGNPFFSFQLLRTLVDDGVLSYDAGSTHWTWSDADVANLRYSDNVIDLMIRRFDRLRASSTALLQQLACVGIRCDEGLLARVAGIDVPEVRNRLSPFVDAGLLIAGDEGYLFQHDRVLESAYSLVPPEARPRHHARIAANMIAHWEGQLAAHAFEICNQIERAADHPLSENERVAFVHTLIVAGKRARNAAAMNQATRYIELAFSLMQPAWWSSHFALAYGASLLRCECLLSQAQLDDASREIDALLERSMTALDKAAVHRLKAVLQTVRSDYEGAISAALSGLALLDVHLQRGPTSEQLRQSYDLVRAALRNRPIASLSELPACDDQRIQNVMALLSTLISSLFVTDGISFLHVAKMVELTLAHGVTPESPYGFSWYGVFIASLYGEYTDGLTFGLAALALVDRRGYEAERIATLVALDQVSAWSKPLSFALGHAQHAVKLGRASGDIGMACYACNHIVSDLLVMGEHLRLIDEEIERGLELTRLIQYQDIQLILYSQRHFIGRLQVGDAPAAGNDDAVPMMMASAQQRLSLSNSQPTRFWVWLYDGMASVFLGDYDRALDSLRSASDLIWSAPAHINTADCRLFLALALAHSAQASADSETQLAQLAEHRDCFDQWSKLNAVTFRSKRLLIDAEIARLRGDYFRALTCYEQSADAAAAAGFVHEQALAHELSGLLCDANGLHSSGMQHIRMARALYQRWGATHKAALLLSQYPHLNVTTTDASANAQRAGGRAAVNWNPGVKAAQAISGEVVMERLIDTLMTNIVVHAGAQYGLLLLMRDDGPMVEASARIVAGKVVVAVGCAEPSEQALPLVVLNSVMRTQETLVLADASRDAPSIRARAGGDPLRSVMCLPLVRGGNLIGIFYLENNLAPGVFDDSRTADLEVLAPQVAVSLETARLYEQLIHENDRRLTAEMDLQSARTELARTSHLTVMGSLAASIAHEVNQPLTAITASVDASMRWLNRATPDLSEVQAGLSHIKRTTERVSEIIRALRALAKQAPSKLELVRLDDILLDVLSVARVEIDAQRVKLVCRLEAGPATVDADRVQLQQVVMNLITNALEAMADTPDDLRELTVASWREQDEIVVCVQDAGTGIPDDVLAQIFDPFFTTKRTGMGMGLAICRSIVETHRGTLEARRHRAGGTELVFRLPLSAGGVDAGF
jgi:predicted ATPase/signal transduction histidine kinase